MPDFLVVVESPAKSRTISKFLGSNYEVVPSMGHLIDLPDSKMGVNIEKGFTPEYAVVKGRKKILTELKEKFKNKKIIYLATDPDREGEAISWHLANHFKSDIKEIARVEFHEITKNAIAEAFSSPRQIDMNKVNAQQARRILDRIVGYTISPLLWKKVSYGLSAGRVQSVAVRLIVEREDKVKAFIPQEYWEIEAELRKKQSDVSDFFKAKLEKINNKKAEIKDETQAKHITEHIEKCDFSVEKIKHSKKVRPPQAPYTTSKLQQDAYNKLKFPAARTMRIAQQLYEGLDIEDEATVGLITYMRTDSVHIAKSAQDEAASYIVERFGKDYLPKTAHKFKTKQKAQGAHEAIRPTSVLRTPEKIKKYLSPEQNKLYNLIWNRFVASQMKAATFNVETIEINAASKNKDLKTENEKFPEYADNIYLFRCTGTTILFDGFLILDGKDEKQDYAAFPKLTLKEQLILNKLLPSQHFTKPPARFTDASLIKLLEENGIGRPSTYAPIISTIINRHYVKRDKGVLFPTSLGIMINELLVKSFPDVLNVEFTALMEDELDKVEDGEMDWHKVLEDFYKPFSLKLEAAKNKMENMKEKHQKTSYKCEQCNRPMIVKWSRRGKFLSCSGFPKCKNAKGIIEKEDGTFEILQEEKTDIICDKCGKPMVVKRSRHGRFLSCSDYPKCKNAKPIPTGVKCPQQGCNGELLERYNRGRVFYGCSNYPNCKYTTRKLENGPAPNL